MGRVFRDPSRNRQPRGTSTGRKRPAEDGSPSWRCSVGARWLRAAAPAVTVSAAVAYEHDVWRLRPWCGKRWACVALNRRCGLREWACVAFLAQSVERTALNRVVVGSIPTECAFSSRQRRHAADPRREGAGRRSGTAGAVPASRVAAVFWLLAKGKERR